MVELSQRRAASAMLERVLLCIFLEIFGKTYSKNAYRNNYEFLQYYSKNGHLENKLKDIVLRLQDALHHNPHLRKYVSFNQEFKQVRSGRALDGHF